MTTKTYYHCDRCGSIHDSNEQMWIMSASLRNARNPSDRHPREKQQDWCRKCVEQFGWLPVSSVEKSDHVIVPPPTLEDIIREIVRSELPA